MLIWNNELGLNSENIVIWVKSVKEMMMAFGDFSTNEQRLMEKEPVYVDSPWTETDTSLSSVIVNMLIFLVFLFNILLWKILNLYKSRIV